MAELRIKSRYRPLPQQDLFHRSKATVRGFGGAMSGGKTRALCEEVFDMMLDLPGIQIAVARSKHTAIEGTTRKTFVEQTLPPELRGRPDLVKIVKSGGYDFVQFLWNGSRVDFYGLDDPGKFFSAEFGAAFVDEAHQVSEDDVITINSRLRQKCPACHAEASSYEDPDDAPDCHHYPHTLTLTFNPSFPGHWLHQWFIMGATRSEFGYVKSELRPTEADTNGSPLGNAEYFISRATDNKYVSKEYVERNLGGMPELQRRRYLEGEWLHISGSGFFDQDALSRMSQAALEAEVFLVGETAGDPTGADKDNPPTVKAHKQGRLEVFRQPVRWRIDDDGTEHEAHRYVVGVDASSGAAADWSAVQVVDADEWEQVAEWQGKVDPDRLAEVAFILGALYNGAMLAPETTGGWGFAVTKSLQRMIREWVGPDRARPKMYTRKVINRLSDAYTDFIGFDTNTKTRAHALALLEEAIRDDSLQVYGAKTLAELAAFASQRNQMGDYGPARAQKGSNDDLVLSLAIAVAVGDRARRQKRFDGRPLVMRTS